MVYILLLFALFGAIYWQNLKVPKSLGLHDPIDYHLANANRLIIGSLVHPLGLGRTDGGRLHVNGLGIILL